MKPIPCGHPTRLCAALVLVCSMLAADWLLVVEPAQIAQAQAMGLAQEAGAAETNLQTAQPTQVDEPQIFGGQEAQPGAWPWQAALVWANQPNAYYGQYCGGTLIAPQWVLTAAHCVDDHEPDEIDVVLGRHNLSSDEGERIKSDQIVIHPDFSYDEQSLSPNLDNDIALIYLATPSTQTPVTLYAGPTGEEETRYIAGTVTGWGLTDAVGYPDALYEVLVPLAPHDVCAQSYGSRLTNNMICAGYPMGYKDSCYGDSGGPLIVRDAQAESWLQVGIVSWGFGCGEPGWYGVYTRVYNFHQWLNTCLADATAGICTGMDDYEPDDRAQQAKSLGSSVQQHNFHARTDRDWLMFEAQAGAIYRIEAQAAAGRGNPLVWLYGGDGLTPLAYAGGSTADAARLEWRAPTTDRYYVELQDLTGARGNGTAYKVTMQTVMDTVYLPLTVN